MKIFIGCSSRDDIPFKYYQSCKEFLNNLFENGYDLVFGTSKHGLMGVCYETAIDNNRNIIGIYPEVYIEDANEVECEKISVKTVNERTEKLIQSSDALVFLPGGIGTLYELLMAIESKRANEHDKPIIIYNCCGFYDRLFGQLDKMYEERFTSLVDSKYFYVCSSSSEVIKYLNKSKCKSRKRK